jgi:hypothetical protein
MIMFWSTIKSIMRKIRLGSFVLRLRRSAQFGFKAEIATFVAKKRYLHRILHAEPLRSDSGSIECFMLLNEARLWEGLWALYSFRFFFGECQLVVLDDGTLKPTSLDILHSLFPGILIPRVIENDGAILAQLESANLPLCLEWRKRYVFFRKLIDPTLLNKKSGMILLDSDCLHFQVPQEVRAWSVKPDQALFIPDVARHSFCAQPEILSKICGITLPEYFCAGYLCIPSHGIQLKRVETYLSTQCFDNQLRDNRFSHVAEQTLQAMEAAVTGAQILPFTYATCPNVPNPDVVAGHFCGGTVKRTWFYTKGISTLARQLRLSGL